MAVFDNGHWKFPEQLDFRKAFGFIYLIREKSTGRMYIGRKNFRSLSKLSRGSPSNWRTYTSSSKSLNALIEENGKEAFSFIAIEQYYTAGGVGWAEVWSQCHVETPSNHGRYFNRLIEKISWKSTEVITARHKARLDAVVKM